MVRWRQVLGYYALACLGSAAGGAVLSAAGSDTGTALGMLVGAAVMWTPALAAGAVARASGEVPFTGIGLAPVLSRWLPIAALFGVALPVVVSATQLLVPGVRWDPEMTAMFARFADRLTPDQVAVMRAQIEALPVHPWVIAVPQALIAGATINALFTVGEELGWRGFLDRELAPLGFWWGSLLTGLMWGFWHAPLIAVGHNYPDHRLTGIFLFTAFCMALSPWLTWLRRRAGTTWAAAVAHGTLNGGGALPMLIAAGSDLAIGVQGVAGVVTLLVSLPLLVFLTRRGRG